MSGVARDLAAKILSAATRALVTASDTTQKMQSLMVQDFEGDDAYEAELVEPVGVSFRAPVGAEVIIVSPDGEPANAVAIVASSRDSRPTADIAEGEGGLYLDGVYRVFLSADGTVHLGAMAASESAAVASLVEAELDLIRNAIAGAAATPNDGGAAFKAAIVAAWGARGAVGSLKVKIEP